MGLPVLILGFSGSGKSSSMRNFKPDELALVNVNGKFLPFRGGFAETLNSGDFRLLYDIYHMVRGGCDPLQDLEKKLPYIAHFHVASLEGRKFPEPDGAIDYRAFFAAVPEGKFNGYVGMEFFPEDPERDLARAAELFLSYQRN